MKRILFFIVIVTLFAFSSVIFAKGNTSEAVTGNQIQNQNQVETQNQGEDSQLRVNTQEQELQGSSAAAKGISQEESSRSETAQENMSLVSQQVEKILTTEIVQGGIGDKVRLIAQEQKEAQVQIKLEINKIDNRKGILKLFIGPDYKALKNLQQEMEQNQLRIQKLQQLENQLENEGEITMIKETTLALEEQNTALQDRINAEEKNNGLLGWLFKLFIK